MSALKGTKQCWSAALPGRHSADAWHSSLFVMVLFPLSRVSVSRKRLKEAFDGIAIDPRPPTRQHRGGRDGAAGAPRCDTTTRQPSGTIARVGRKRPDGGVSDRA